MYYTLWQTWSSVNNNKKIFRKKSIIYPCRVLLVVKKSWIFDIVLILKKKASSDLY